MNTAAEVTGYAVWAVTALVFGSLLLAMVNGWRVERAQRRAEAVRAHPAGSFEQHADQAIALGCEDWRDEAGVYPVLTDAEIAAFWQANR